MGTMRYLTVFAGSATGDTPLFEADAVAFGEALLRAGIGIVCGGGAGGLMGALTRTVYEGGGDVVGIIPAIFAADDVPERPLTRVEMVGDLHERKRRMSALGDGFVALPGGIGTLDELIDTWTWRQLGLHHKPVGLLNTDHFWDAFSQQIDVMVQRGFLSRGFRQALVAEDDPGRLVEHLLSPCANPSIT